MNVMRHVQDPLGVDYSLSITRVHSCREKYFIKVQDFRNGLTIDVPQDTSSGVFFIAVICDASISESQ